MPTLIQTFNEWGGQASGFALSMVVQSSILMVVLGLMDWLLHKRARAIVRYSLWLLLLVKLLLPVTLSLPTSLVRISPEIHLVPKAASPAGAAPFPAPFALSRASVPPEPDFFPAPASDTLVSTVPTDAPRTAQPLSMAGWLLAGWLGTVIVLLALAAMKSLQLGRLVQSCRPASEEIEELLAGCQREMGLSVRVAVRVGDAGITPALCGIFRPVILLPSTLTAALGRRELRPVLLHELAHLRRRDVLVNLAQTLLQIAYFFHPLLWLANARIRQLREEAVDETVLVVLGDEAEIYPATLLDVARFTLRARSLTLGSVGIMESRSAFTGRIRRMLSQPFPTRTRLGVASALTLAALAACLLPMATRAAKDKVPQAPPAESPDAFLRALRYYPDPFFPNYQTVTNRVAQLANELLPLILADIQQPVPDLSNQELREERGRKIWALGLMGAKAAPAIPALIKELSDEDPAIPRGPHYLNYPPSFWAAQALGRIGPAASYAVPALIDAAHFGNYLAVPALAGIAPDSKAVAELAVASFKDLSKGNGANASPSRLSALQALTLLAGKHASCRACLLEAVREADPPVRNAVIKALKISPVPGSAEAIESALAADSITRVNTAAALVNAGDASERVQEILRAGLAEPATRLRALETLAASPQIGANLIPVLLPFVQDSEKDLRHGALNVLARLRDAKSEPLLQAVLPLVNETEADTAALALLVIRQNGLKTPAVVEAVRKSLHSQQVEVVQAALQTAEYTRITEIQSDLKELLRSSDAKNSDAQASPQSQLRAGILTALGNYPEAARPLVPEIARELNGEIGWAAAIALANLGTNAVEAVPALIQAIQGTNQNALNNSVFALSRIGPAARSAVPQLEKLKDHPDPMIQLNVARALWRIDGQTLLVSVLQDRLTSDDHWDRLSLLNRTTSLTALFQAAMELGPEARPLYPIFRGYLRNPDPQIRQAAEAELGPLKLLSQTSPYAAKSNRALLAEYRPRAETSSRPQAAIAAELTGRPDFLTFAAEVLRRDPKVSDSPTLVENRRKVAVLLARKGPAAVSAVPRLVDALEDEEDVRREATACLAAIGPAAASAIPTLLEELHFQNPRAAEALARIAPASAEVQEAILKAVLDPAKTSDFRSESLMALRWMTVRTASLLSALDGLAKDPDERMRSNALFLQGTVQPGLSLPKPPWDGKTTNDIPALLAEIRAKLAREERDRDNSLLIALNTLDKVGRNSDEALDLYLEILEKRSVRYLNNIATAIGHQGPHGARGVPQLIRLTSDDERGFANNAILALGEIGPAAAAARPRLRELLDDPDPDFRWKAANSLRQIDPSELDRCLPFLLAPFVDSTQRPSLSGQFDVLGQIGLKANLAVPRLLKLLDEPEWKVPASAALARIDPACTVNSVHSLVQILQDPGARDPQIAASYLGTLGRAAVSAMPALQKAAAQTDNWLLQQAASNAVTQIQTKL